MEFLLVVKRKSKTVVSVKIGNNGLIIGTNDRGDLLLPEILTPFTLSLSPTPDGLAFKTDDRGLVMVHGKSLGRGILRSGESMLIEPYTLFVTRCDDALLFDDPLKNRGRTVVFDAGKGLLEVSDALLCIVKGDNIGRTFSILGDHLVIGSDEFSNIPIMDPFVSATHATLTRKPGGFLLQDQGSTNGTFLGEARVMEILIEPGAEFQVGQTTLRLEQTVDKLDVPPSKCTVYGGMIGQSRAMKNIFGLIDKVAPTDATVLISGQSGTGKELAARAVHNFSDRAQGPFIAINCGAIPRDLVETELFGHVKGAFSGAHTQRRGAFELAHGGTLFLDEISELPPLAQPKLLRVLEQRTIRKVGGEAEIPVDVRIVAATNRDLRMEALSGRFREDLYYRLSMIPIALPLLSQRKPDICLLAEHFIADEAQRLNLATPPTLSEKAKTRLEQYPWPGNVRELRNAVKRAMILGDYDDVLNDDAFSFESASNPATLEGSLENLERQAVKRALAGSKTRKQAAEKLGIALSTLYEKMKKFHFDSVEEP